MRDKNLENKVDDMMKIALASDEEPGEELNRRILRSWKEQTNMKRQVAKKIYAVAAACGALMITVSAGAAVKYLRPAEAAERSGMESERIEAAFESKDAIEINESKEAGDYRFTLLGITTEQGINASQISGELNVRGDIYAIVAIERMDGTPMPDTSDEAYSDLRFFMSPLVDGLTPWRYNTISMGGGYSDFVENGILYRVIVSDDITMFADRDIHLCVSDTTFYDTNAYYYDEASGEITRNESYEGINLLFDLPIDADRADAEKAAEYMKALEASWSSEDTEEVDEEEGWDVATGKIEEMINEICDQIVNVEEEKALEGAELIPEYTQIVTEENGLYQYKCSFDVEEEEIIYFYKDNFKNGKDVMICYGDYNEESVSIEGIYISVLTEMGDGTAEINTYYKEL